MNHPATPLRAKLVSRPNRFLGVVELDGEEVECFIPNPGRMHELMVPRTTVYIIPRRGDQRKTRYDLTLVEYNDTLVSIDSRLPNYILREAVTANILPMFRGYSVQRMEPSYGDSRFDLQLGKGSDTILVEAKSCTLVENGVALFPDAPTKRGARHMNTLAKALKQSRAAVIFIIQREDARIWRPHRRMDPDFADSLGRAIENGVEAYAYNCVVSLDEVKLSKRVPISLE